MAGRPGAWCLVGINASGEPLSRSGSAGKLEQPRGVDLLDPVPGLGHAARVSHGVQLSETGFGICPLDIAAGCEQLAIVLPPDLEDHLITLADNASAVSALPLSKRSG
jgi:hypothetical protein